MLVRIDDGSDEAVYVQIAASVRGDIADGRLSAGDRLPAAKSVATAIGVNLHTVLHAYQLLRDEGLVVLRPGRGASVTAAAAGLAGLSGDVRRLIARADELGVDRDALAALVRGSAAQTGKDAP